jgi:hypothetical protein
MERVMRTGRIWEATLTRVPVHPIHTKWQRCGDLAALPPLGHPHHVETVPQDAAKPLLPDEVAIHHLVVATTLPLAVTRHSVETSLLLHIAGTHTANSQTETSIQGLLMGKLAIIQGDYKVMEGV